MQLRSLDKITRQHLVVILINIGLHIVNLILITVMQQGFLAFGHYFFIGFLNLYGIEFQHIARLQIDKTIRAVLKVQILFQIAIEDMEQDDLVFVIFQM